MSFLNKANKTNTIGIKNLGQLFTKINAVGLDSEEGQQTYDLFVHIIQAVAGKEVKAIRKDAGKMILLKSKRGYDTVTLSFGLVTNNEAGDVYHMTKKEDFWKCNYKLVFHSKHDKWGKLFRISDELYNELTTIYGLRCSEDYRKNWK